MRNVRKSKKIDKKKQIQTGSQCRISLVKCQFLCLPRQAHTLPIVCFKYFRCHKYCTIPSIQIIELFNQF